jgi:hypothetical protein
MLNEKTLLLNRHQALEELQPQERTTKSFWAHSELLIISAFIVISSYFIVKLALQTGRLTEISTQHEQSIMLTNQQLKGHADRLQRFEDNDRQVRQSLREANSRNGRIETRLSHIEDDDIALKRANARIVANERNFREQLDRLDARAQRTIPQAAAPVAPAPAPATVDPARQKWSGLVPPPGTLAYKNALNEEIWLISRDGKEEQLRPIQKTRRGYRVHNLTDGKDYFLTTQGDLVASSGQ